MLQSAGEESVPPVTVPETRSWPSGYDHVAGAMGGGSPRHAEAGLDSGSSAS